MSRKRLDILLDGMTTQAAVLKALCLRELQHRFGRSNIGYLWVIAEPMLLASVVTMLHSVVVSHGGDGGFSPYTFMLTGYSIYIIFRNTFNRAEGALNAAAPLLFHRMITPFDIMLSKAVIETLGCLSALVFLQTAGIILGIADVPARPLALLGAVFLYAWWTFGLSLLVAAYTYEGHFIGRLVHPASYFALPLSGAFITMTLLPAWTRPYMEWNPMMSVFEMARYGQFEGASDTYVHTGYVVAVAAFTFYWGLLAIRRVRQHIHAH
ncbi:MAG TPA: ABC transporter permease [Novosphingobium sp.]|nr:ABC transporter permease [Novosphingobium sp.]